MRSRQPYAPNRRSERAAGVALALLIFAGMTCGGVHGEEAPVVPAEAVRALIGQGKYGDAEARAREVLAQVELEGGAESAAYTAVLDALVEARWRGGKATDPETRELGEKALALKERLLGPEHADVAESLNNLAVIAFFLGDYAGAEPLWRRALDIRTASLGAKHPDVAQLMNNLGNLYLRTGDFEAALPVYEGALAIRREALGEEHPLVGQSYNNMAVLLTEMGDYVAALPMAEKGLALYEKLLPPGHPKTASALQVLARVRLETGEVERGLELLEQVEAMWEKSLGPEHPSLASAINNRADQLRKLGRLEEAGPAYERALAVYEKAYGPEHPEVAICLSGLGALAEAKGDLPRAIELQERVLAIREKMIGKDHPRVAVTLTQLGNLRFRAGDSAQAAAMLERAIDIRTGALGPEHPDVAESTLALARVRAAAGETAAAITAALRAEEITREHLRLTGRSLSEEHALLYAGSREAGLDLALTMAAAGKLSGAQRRDVLDALVRSRAVVLDGIAARNRTALTAGDPEIARLASELAAARSRLASMTVRGLGSLDAATYRALLEDARAEKERAERALAAASAEFAAQQERGRLGLAEVVESLPSDAALLAFAAYRHLDLGTGGAPVPSYVAIALRAGDEAPAVVPIGPAADLERLVATWRSEVGAAAVVRHGSENAEAAYRPVGEKLRARLWDPVADRLEEAGRVFVVPDGALNLVSLAALPVADRQYLLERGPLLHYLSAERDLVPMGEGPPAGVGLLAVGAPDYDAVPGAAAVAAPTAGEEEIRTRSTRSGCASFEALSFEPLPEAAREAERIVALWREEGSGGVAGVTYLTRSAASEAAFKREAPGHRVLHLATHGFFLGNDCAAAGGTRGVGGIAMVSKSDDAAPAAPTGSPTPSPAPAREGTPPAGQAVAVESPLLLSGLALASANRRSEAGTGEDGILTAEEIASLDLSGVELAVLSACDTGSGEIRAGEGVFGLRRAMQVAGVRAQVLSLWAVDDESTRQWMEALYGGLLRDGLDPAEAARAAGLAVLNSRREAGESTHPFFWAAFVATGG